MSRWRFWAETLPVDELWMPLNPLVESDGKNQKNLRKHGWSGGSVGTGQEKKEKHYDSKPIRKTCTGEAGSATNFIKNIIIEHNRTGRFEGRVHTRFPPEPNGYLHIGHAKSICLNFGLAQEYRGLCNLRFDDTNPVKEEQEYIDAIIEDVRWLGFNWEDRLYYASDYFQKVTILPNN